MAPSGPITTPFTTLLGIQHPVVLAGMARVSGGELAAAVSNAGGLGVIGGFQYTPDQLREIIAEMKANLARHGILVMNMVGHPKHAVKALDRGVDMVCAQGTEGGGHTGDVANSVLIPAVAEVARRYRPAMLGGSATALVVAAGGICDGRGLASSLMQGATAVWVGTRFVAETEANWSEEHKQAVVECDYDGIERTLVISGRPIRMKPNDYIRRWHRRPQEIQALCDRGVVPIEHDFDEGADDIEIPHLMGQVAGSIRRVQPAREIVEEMVAGAVEMLETGGTYLAGGKSKL